MEEFTAIFKKKGDHWIGYAEEYPGANTLGRTLHEARENLKETVRLVWLAHKKTKESDYTEDMIVKEVLKVSIHSPLSHS